MLWDVSNGVSRRSWAGGENAQFYAKYLMSKHEQLVVTLPNTVKTQLLEKIFKQADPIT